MATHKVSKLPARDRKITVLTLFFPPDRIAIYKFTPAGLRLVRMLNGVERR